MPRAEPRAPADLLIRLPFRPPYDWPAMIAFLKARAIPGVERVSDESYARTIAVGGRQGTIAVTPGTGDQLLVTIHGLEPGMASAAIDRVRHVFDVDADPIAVGRHLAADPLLAPLVAARPGLRLPGGWDPFELAVRAVLGQQITVRAAVALAQKITVRYGEPLTGVDVAGLTHIFPRPERLASADVATLGMPQARARALVGLAAAVADEPRLLDAGSGLDDRVTRLMALRGIGEWTAHYIAMRALGERDAFPAGDVALQRAMASLAGRTMNARDLLASAERWRPLRAYAAQHLWTAASRARE